MLLTFAAEKPPIDFGQHVSGVGDVNGDGYADVIVGAPGNSAGGEGAGRAYVYSGKDGRVLLTLTGEAADDAFGSAVAGSLGTARLVPDRRRAGAGPRHAGRTYVYNGLSPKPAFVIDADDTGTALGAMFLSTVGDVNRDGVPDVYASDFTNAAKGPSTGRIYVHSGADGRRLLTLTGEDRRRRIRDRSGHGRRRRRRRLRRSHRRRLAVRRRRRSPADARISTPARTARC